ncbi:putative Co/Zn/Cd efflux system membrane fusion protein [Winogradskyella psychrotolerans RS-3]|uniref:Putative Co/Zn/Cd efflux system membrane fusion protein n=1 Tax=Winogradskyella psychrotolerans RS-3 TaxID=641526 RepID=S7VXC4_9FLAO|nr:DUF3347 domain-containing protein [Winogradskyella psychrotolerans]EPR74072.1 putative Co/Zn/Cd efflux system membrane fusion protein [Winogradskyella psychrotolerans RS-3]
MKNLKVTTAILVIAFIGFTAMSCKDGKKEVSNDEMHSEMNHDNSDGHHDGEENEMAMSDDQNGSSENILKDYFNLKDALVADDESKGKELGAILVESLDNLDVSKYTDDQKSELNDIIVDATEHAEHISESPMEHQREHFKILSKDVTDMVAITGTENTLYEQFCPMYDKGSAWLSMSKDVKNPYYGSKMLTCGKVQKEIN